MSEECSVCGGTGFITQVVSMVGGRPEMKNIKCHCELVAANEKMTKQIDAHIAYDKSRAKLIKTLGEFCGMSETERIDHE